VSNPAALPIAALTITGLLLTALGVFGGGTTIVAIGVVALVAAGLIGVLGSRASRAA
jgi:hypothetical protein